MIELERISPVVYKSTPVKTENRDNWEVVMEYSGEGDGPYLIDLSHKPRFDLQDGELAVRQPFGISLPETPGSSVFENGILANRMNRTQVSLYNLDNEDNSTIINEPGITDVTEATVFVALIGKDIFSICEKLSALDFMDPTRTAPFLFQGPFSHVPCQIVTLEKEGDNGGLVLTCSRGYGQDMIHSILQAGDEFGLKPAGEDRFTEWINSL
ncbi:MAG: sarcosine oxidase subunit gamma SoxG [Desulfobulbaceae bacterium S5133MH15]|nr:MAG: sarcosine oxidase subunit gamma SoxG [Desulfobulbaceae bacterium S5133MH15]OEU83015.1 MAG: sarcosine oxidase subunit gamma SoxG [Desulfobulbaceae bacterium C00003063]